MTLKKIFGAGLFLLCTLSGVAQSYTYPKNTAALKALREELREETLRREVRVKNYLNQRSTESRSFEKGGKQYFLHDVVNGNPQYLITHNEISARSMGLDEVRAGGRFGLDITGKGIRVGVWDAGLALRTHQEYSGRLQNNDSGTDEADHACHVMGTLIAAGVKPEARGMLYEANSTAYDWNQAFEEMITESLENDLLVSNHSYGFGTGWENGNWLGDASISNEEDYRFGFYGSRSGQADAIAFNAPYYSIFKSAGNDRGDSGNGIQPTDGPYDCIGDWGVAKNVFTIGAVQKLNAPYSKPADIVMSGFSSWGPVDDGRIKPDLVAPGVNIYSSICAAEDAYSNLSGTSMSSPSAAGAITAVNEAHRLFYGNYLRSATLKALMIQTAFEAGNTPGPDYAFGWGMVNVAGAVELINQKDDINSFIIESSLLNRDSFVLPLNPVAGEKITATLAWTDAPGSPAPASLDPTKLMLINDLDMRIVNEEGAEVRPWILDPSAPGKAASRGDNFRDNVEQIVFNNPQPRKYFLVIKHKGDLNNGRQDFSLILKYKSEAAGLENLYWVNNNGNWSDTDQWSETSGGNTAALTPQANSRLIFDNNSFSNDVHRVTIDQDYEVAGIVSLNNKQVVFDLKGHTLTVSGPVIIGSTNFTITNGTLLLRNTDSSRTNQIDLNRTRSNGLKLVIAEDNEARWVMGNSQVAVEQLSALGGRLALNNSQLNVASLRVGATGNFILSDSRINQLENLQIAAPQAWQDDFDSEISLQNTDTPLRLQAPGINFNARFIIDNSTLMVAGNNTNFDYLELAGGRMEQDGNVKVFDLTLSGGSTLQIAGGKRLEIFRSLLIASEQDNEVTISSGNDSEKAELLLAPHEKYCFDYLLVDGVDLAGPAAVSVGANSTLSNAENWFSGLCENLLFADFEVQYACAGSLAQLIDFSDGNIATYRWYVDGNLIGGDSITEFRFADTLTYQIRLEILDAADNQSSWEETVKVVPSGIPDNRIIQNATQLASFNLADSYQWYRNGEPIPGATERAYRYEGEAAVYFVVTYQGDCNKQSEVLDLLGTAVENLDREGSYPLDIFPNPSREKIFFRHRNGAFTQFNLTIYNAYGQALYRSALGAGSNFAVDIAAYSPGIYLLVMDTGKDILTKKIIKQ